MPRKSDVSINYRALYNQRAGFEGPTSKFKKSRYEYTFNKGAHLFKGGFYLDAIEIWNKLVYQIPNNTILWDSLGVAHIQSDNLPKALECFQILVDLEPNNADNWKKLGIALSVRNIENMNAFEVADDTEEVCECFEKSIKYDSEDFELILRTGIGYAKLGNNKKANKYFSKFLDRFPNDPSVKQMLDSINKEKEILEVEREFDSLFCFNCGTGVKSEQKFCPKCGQKINEDTPVIDKQVCPICGIILSGKNFCTNCGNKLIDL